jgi:predicted RecA/RadA family phage recombinase
VALQDAAAGAELELLTEGVVELAKATPLASDLGDRRFWDATNQRLDKTATAQVCVGLAAAALHSGGGLATVPIFVLVPQVTIRKRLDVAVAARKWIARLPALVLGHWPSPSVE